MNATFMAEEVRALREDEITDEAVSQLNEVLINFSKNAVPRTPEEWGRLARMNVLAAAILNGRIVGMATLVWYDVPTGIKCRVEDVAVLEDFRERGLGRKLMEYLHLEARAWKFKKIDLTSRESREVARKLYLSLGYVERKESALFRLDLGT